MLEGMTQSDQGLLTNETLELVIQITNGFVFLPAHSYPLS